MILKKAITRIATSMMITAGLLVTLSIAQAADSAPTDEAPNTLITQPKWVAPGIHVQYPNEGGTWEYGFWNVKFRSYYTVNRCHGTTVKSGSRTSRSANTAKGKKSIAELWGVNSSGANPHYHYRVC